VFDLDQSHGKAKPAEWKLARSATGRQCVATIEHIDDYIEALMTHLGPHKSGLVLGSLLGGWHLIWAIIVAASWGQPLIDFVFWMHFLKPVFVVDTFTIGRAIVLILVTAAVGYCIGYLGALIWNRLHAR
jgi:hypothetical protein